MIKRLYIALGIIFCFISFSWAQLPAAQESAGLLYRKEVSGGLTLHTRGWGVFMQYGKQKNYKYLNLYGFDLGNIKHPKEARFFRGIFSDTKSFFYGKQNAVFVMRPTFGGRLVLTEKIRMNPVGISLQWRVGPAFAFLKPVYLEIIRIGSNNQSVITSERYDPELHSLQDINGSDSWVKGLNEVKVEPGIHSSFSLYFDFSEESHRVFGMELGTFIDVYRRELPIMANSDNLFFYPTLFAKLTVGMKMF